jgi:hypothetical protein
MRAVLAKLRELHRAIDELGAIDPSEMSDADLNDAAIGLQQADSLLCAVRARYLSAWEIRRLWADDGSKAAAARLARECGLATATARRELRRARRLRDMPCTAAALIEGKLSIDQADVLVHVNQPAVAALFERDESLLVDQVKTLRYNDGMRVAKYWLSAAHDEVDHDPWSRAVSNRYVTAVRTMSDSVVLDGMLDTVAGTVFMNELRRLEQQLFEADWAVALTEHGDEARADQLARTAGQRRADALVEMARRSSAISGDGRPARPLITVVTGYDTFAKMCELADGTVVAPGQVIPLLGETDVERIVFEGPSRVIDVGVRQRFFTGALRRAIEVRDRHCQHPSGWDVPAEECDIDHKVPYSEGGLTTQANGRCYCRRHNLDRNHRRNASDTPDVPDPPEE